MKIDLEDFERFRKENGYTANLELDRDIEGIEIKSLNGCPLTIFFIFKDGDIRVRPLSSGRTFEEYYYHSLTMNRDKSIDDICK